MIKTSKVMVGNKCRITIDFSPEDIRYSRSNYTAVHKGGGTTSRLGIWEGIQCTEAQVKVGDAAWKIYNLPSNNTVTVDVDSNNVTVYAQGRYRLKTMGYYFKDTKGYYPFFWYGNIGGVEHRYKKGSFRDSMSSKPDSSFYSVNACVPADWVYMHAEWSDWAYKHAATTSDWQKSNGRYAQRNGNATSASYSNGWISDSGNKQIYRKSSLFVFDRYYDTSITSSGVAVNPGIPTIKVIPSKGDSGKIELYYNSNNSGDGKIAVEAKCKDKIATVMTYNDSPNFGEQWKKTLYPDFNSLFGESYRANDVVYRVKAKNNIGYESAWSGWHGVNRYNGRPTTPNNLRVEGVNGLIYDNVDIKWNQASDPDGDAIVYDLWIKIIQPSGTLYKEDFLTKGVNGLSYRYNISNFVDSTSFEILVRSTDNLLVSSWSPACTFKKGTKPNTVPSLIAPVYENSNIYASKQRFAFSGYDNQSTCVVVFNGVEYNSSSHSNMFELGGSKFIFKPSFTMPEGKVTLKSYLTNPYGTGYHSKTYTFTKKSIADKLTQYELAKASDVNVIQKVVSEICDSFRVSPNIKLANVNDYHETRHYNDSFYGVSEVNNYLNNITSSSKFDYRLNSKNVTNGEINRVLLWKQLISDIINM